MEIEFEKRDVGYYTHSLLGTFKAKKEVRFSEVFDRSEGRYGMIGMLIAMLEMMKQGYLRARQDQCFDEILLAYIGKEEVTADQILAGISAEDLAEQEEQDLERLQSEVAAQAEAPDPADADEDAQG